ncbi:SRPBCC family protein [Algirhabdus cladophorae]|uniref:SRPBCC family protein n=1 Tax=Algirhabdus cladophorae TaxID=3377108 RepID=UPI003B8473A2
MKFSTREDIEAPIEFVYKAITDFDAFERAAMRRGADVERTAGQTAKGVGTSWIVAFEFRGKPRELKGALVEADAPNRLRFEGTLSGLDVALDVDLVALSKKRTRLHVATELKPRSLSARLLIQSLRLAKTSLTKRFKSRIAEFAEDLEDRHRRGVSA